MPYAERLNQFVWADKDNIIFSLELWIRSYLSDEHSNHLLIKIKKSHTKEI